MALTAPPETQALLLELQQFDTRLAQLDHRAKSLPEHAELEQLAKQADEVRRTLGAQTGALDDVNAELKRTESDVEVVEARIKRDAERLQASSSVKDVAGLEHEIAALQKRLNDLEEIELVVMERVEEQQAAVNQTRAQHEALRSRIADVESARDAALATIAAERAAAVDDRRVLQTSVPNDLLALYEKQRARYGWGASLLQGGVSSASGVKLNESDMAVIRAATPETVLLCPDSNAILVRTAESGL
jgi:predicted  nucleic acid-binding Zn-ribbon protein